MAEVLQFDLDPGADCSAEGSGADRVARPEHGTHVSAGSKRARRFSSFWPPTSETPPPELDDVKAAFAVIGAHIRTLEPASALDKIRRYRGELSALETEVLAAKIAADGNDRAAKALLNDGKTSRRSINRAAKRGEAVDKNKALATKMASGDLSEEQLDVLADAAARTDGAAAVDDDLIAKIAAVDPDQGRGIADDYVNGHANAEDTQTEHDRQRAQRRASQYLNKRTGLATISLQGDSVAINNMWDAIEAHADHLYQNDGGRDLDAGRHPRTNLQRRFDAAHEMLCGTASILGSRTADDDGTTGESTAAGPAGRTARTGRYTPPKSRRPQIVIGLTLDKLLGRDPSAVAQQIGLGAIADTVLADYTADADILAALFDRNGQPLWLGRLTRHASVTQRIALILRDKHCVLCTAPHTRCDAHHLTPWNAPTKGTTNLDQLALLCPTCHRKLHNDNHTLYRDATGAWRTRPATPAETPPPRPQRPPPARTPQRE